MENFIKNKWHLHSLTLPISLLVLKLKESGFMQLDKVGEFWAIFLILFFSLFFAGIVEMVQGLLGANRTKKEVKASRLDILTSVIASVVGITVYYVFTSQVWIFIVISIIIISILEYNRRNDK